MSETLFPSASPKGRRGKVAKPPPFSAGFIETADLSVRSLLQGSTTLSQFLASAGTLTAAEKRLIVEQALVMLESFYVHLPLKRAMHAVDPVQRLRLLRKRLPAYASDTAFHAEMVDIFTSVRDLHTLYMLPSPFAEAYAYLPFRVEACKDGARRIYIVGGVATGFTHPTFKPGVEIRYWNGTPIVRAVAAAAAKHAGSNAEARRSRGIAGLTARPLKVTPAPDEEWVVVGYRTPEGADLELRFDWLVAILPGSGSGGGGDGLEAARGVDLETQLVQQARRILFAPQSETQRAALADAPDPLSVVQGLESTLPEVFMAREVVTAAGTFGHIRIWTFNEDPEPFVAEFVRLAGLLPQTGLIVDVRDNGGGNINAGEQLLQVLAPGRIEPERTQFINTPLVQKLCELNSPCDWIELDLAPWLPSVARAVETGAAFSAGHPMTTAEAANAIGQRYPGPVVLITSARCYSTTDIFSAGFQDHGIGPVLGVDGNTGAGGANVWQHRLLQRLFATGNPPRVDPASPFKALPKNAGLSVAIRRTVRVGPNAGTEVEDLGVTPNERHEMTRADILDGNVDLMERAGALLAAMPVYALGLQTAPQPGGGLRATISHGGVDRLDVYVDGRPAASRMVTIAAQQTVVDLDFSGAVCRVEGFRTGKLAVARQEPI